MRLLLSKFLRNYAKDYPPYTCYAGLYMPQAINETCDCKTFCKFPPKGNTGIPNQELLLDNPHHEPEPIFMRNYQKSIKTYPPINTFRPNQILLRNYSGTVHHTNTINSNIISNFHKDSKNSLKMINTLIHCGN